MRGRFFSGILHPTFRQARSSAQPVLRHGSAARRFWLSTTTEQTPITQRMQFARTYEADDLICPVKYFKEEFDFLKSLDGNELLKVVGKKGRSKVSTKAAKAVRSLAGIICGNHAKGIACGQSLKLSNLRISRSLGEFAMVEPPKPRDQPDSLRADFRLGADLLEELARLVLGPDVVMPKVWNNFIAKMREESPNVELIMYHSMFLPLSVSCWLLVKVDQRFRKDFDSLTKEEKTAIRKFIKDLGKKRMDDLSRLLKSNEFLKFISLKSRSGSRGRKGKPNSELKTDDAVWGDKARDIMSYNRDGVVHGCKSDLNKEERAAMPSIKSYWRTQENIVELLEEEFELLEQDYIDLCWDKAKILWKLLGMPELFGETDDTWKDAVAAIDAELKRVKDASLVKGRASLEEIE